MNEYLNYTMLNEIESKIKYLYDKFLEKFNLSTTYLRKPSVGDNLSGKKIYLYFPRDSREIINLEEATYEKILELDSGYFFRKFNSEIGNLGLTYNYANSNWYLYNKYVNENNPRINYLRFFLPRYYGKVTTILEDNIFNYIKIKDNDFLPCNFEKKNWLPNEVVYMQDIDRIEQSIKEIVNTFIMPEGYEDKVWIKDGYYNSKTANYGLEQKSISRRDFDRWNRNISLILENIDDSYNIWNLESNIFWNELNEFEWENYDG